MPARVSCVARPCAERARPTPGGFWHLFPTQAIEGPGAPGRNVWESSQVNPRTINSAMSREFGDEQESWPVVAVARVRPSPPAAMRRVAASARERPGL